MSASASGDLEVVTIVLVIFLATVFTPFIPILNRLPRWLGIYKLIWRDWYRRTADSEQGIDQETG